MEQLWGAGVRRCTLVPNALVQLAYIPSHCPFSKRYLLYPYLGIQGAYQRHFWADAPAHSEKHRRLLPLMGVHMVPDTNTPFLGTCTCCNVPGIFMKWKGI